MHLYILRGFLMVFQNFSSFKKKHVTFKPRFAKTLLTYRELLDENQHLESQNETLLNQMDKLAKQLQDARETIALQNALIIEQKYPENWNGSVMINLERQDPN